MSLRKEMEKVQLTSEWKDTAFKSPQIINSPQQDVSWQR